MSGFEHHRKSDRVIATFTGFEADLLRSLASQMVELLRNERAEPAAPTADAFEALMSEFSGATTPYRRPSGSRRGNSSKTDRRPAVPAASAAWSIVSS